MVLVGGFNFRLGTYNVPPGSSAPSLTTSTKREFDGTDGSDGPEKCPLNFFELCGYLEHVYISWLNFTPPHHNFYFWIIGIWNIPSNIPRNMKIHKIEYSKKNPSQQESVFFEYVIFQNIPKIYNHRLAFFHSPVFLVHVIFHFFTSQHFFAVYWNMEYSKINASQHKKWYFWNMEYSRNIQKK